MTRYPIIPIEDMHLLTEYDGDPIVIDGPETYDAISSVKGAPSFEYAQWYIERVLLFLNGDAHRKLTKTVSQLFAEKYDDIPAHVSFTDEQKALISSGKTFSIVDDICEPAVESAHSLYMKCPESSLDYLREYNAVAFHRELRFGKFKKLDVHLANIFSASQASEDTKRYCDTIPTIIVARQTMLRGLVMSLDEVFKTNESVTLADLRIPMLPPKSSIPYVHRVVPEDLSGKQGDYKTGEIYLCPVSMRIGEKNPPLLPSFGSGVRACLGRTMTLLVWRTLACELNELAQNCARNGLTKFEILEPADFGEFGDRPTRGEMRLI